MSIHPSISPQKHRLQANININLAPQVLTISPPWAVVVAFYAALHYLDEYASYYGVCFLNHTERRNWLSSRIELRSIEIQYEMLYKRSRLVRYDCPGPNHFLNKKDDVAIMLPWANNIRDSITQAEIAAGFVGN